VVDVDDRGAEIFSERKAARKIVDLLDLRSTAWFLFEQGWTGVDQLV
jgi:hypothetical protein